MTTKRQQESISIRDIPATGVIFASMEARRLGWGSDGRLWSNLGQGQAETGPLPGSPPRVESINIECSDHGYAPVLGVSELREAVADYYNRNFRRGLGSKYTAENVAIASGGRVALTRAAASLGSLNLGHFLPDYTAYEELIESFRLVTPIPILLRRDQGFTLESGEFEREIRGNGLGAVLFSNPSNPTGRLISGQELLQWISTAGRLDCTLLIDEFYSHYIWKRSKDEPGPSVSAARWIEDVNRSSVVIFDGLSKNWRYPGWRISWTVGPRHIIRSIGNAGSFLDGGAPRPLQRKAIELLGEKLTRLETQATQSAFLRKRSLLLRRCQEMNLEIDMEPEGGFYAFVSLRHLPSPLCDSFEFFREALEYQVITVPGSFFDINPGKRKPPDRSRFGTDIRLSFGPSEEELSHGLAQLKAMIEINIEKARRRP
ncbi:MAG: pyridoxal phosphate-dependent aminotransferase [Acidobacteriota bacterium]